MYRHLTYFPSVPGNGNIYSIPIVSMRHLMHPFHKITHFLPKWLKWSLVYLQFFELLFQVVPLIMCKTDCIVFKCLSNMFEEICFWPWQVLGLLYHEEVRASVCVSAYVCVWVHMCVCSGWGWVTVAVIYPSCFPMGMFQPLYSLIVTQNWWLVLFIIIWLFL